MNHVVLLLKKATYYSLPRTVVLNQGSYVPQGQFWQCQKAFLVVQLRVGCIWHLAGSDQECY